MENETEWKLNSELGLFRGIKTGVRVSLQSGSLFGSTCQKSYSTRGSVYHEWKLADVRISTNYLRIMFNRDSGSDTQIIECSGIIVKTIVLRKNIS